MKTEISVIVPCYNLAEFLPEALDSVAAQTFQDWECIVVNDGSTDRTGELAARYAAADKRFKIVETPNGGVIKARNLGVKSSTGKYLLFLDADDILMPDYMDKAMSLFRACPGLKLVGGQAEFFGKGVPRRVRRVPPFSMERLIANNCIYVTSFIPREEFERAGGFAEGLAAGWEDWDLWMSVLGKDSDAVILDDVVFRYRLRRGSRNNSLSQEKKSALRRVLWERHKDLYGKFFFDPTLSGEYEKEHYYASKYSSFPGVRLYRFISSVCRNILYR